MRTRSRWLVSSFWAVSDQAFYAGAQFVLNVLLARWLSPSDYGVFAVAYSILLLAGTAHTALVAEPMLVLGPKREPALRGSYLRTVIRLHGVFSFGMGGLLGVCGVIALAAGSGLGPGLLSLAFFGPMILFLWQSRRACYVMFQPGTAALGSLAYFMIVVAATALAGSRGFLSLVGAFGLMGLASLVVGALIAFRLTAGTSRGTEPALRDVLLQHWVYGKWALSSAAFTWIPRNLPFFILPILYGMEVNGVFKALTNLVMPALQVNTALGVLLIPTLATTREVVRTRRTFWRALGLMTGASIAYWLTAVLWRGPLVRIAYNSPVYSAYVDLLILMGLLPVLTAVIEVLGSVIRAREQPAHVLGAYLPASVVAAVTIYPFAAWWGIAGATASILLSYLLVIALLAVPTSRLLRAAELPAPAVGA